MKARPIEILLVEDSPSDAELTIEALRDAKLRNNLTVIEDGVQATEFVHRKGRFAKAPRPDLILLELSLPRKDGREVLAELKADRTLSRIPVVVLTASDSEQEMLRAHAFGADYYINKPVQPERFLELVRAIESFRLFVETFPRTSNKGHGVEKRK